MLKPLSRLFIAVIVSTACAGAAAASTSPAFTPPESGGAQASGAKAAPPLEPTPPQTLKRAVSLIDEDPRRAVLLLEELSDSYPLLEDVVLLQLARAQARSGAAEARTVYENLLAGYPKAAVAMFAAAELAELLAAQGDLAGVFTLAEKYRKPGALPGAASAAGAAYLARIYLSAGKSASSSKPSAAADYLLRARKTAPSSAPAVEAGRLLARLRESRPELRPKSADAVYEEAELLGREGRLDEQAKLLESFLDTFPGDSRRLPAMLSYARALSRVSGHSVAADYLRDQSRKASSKHLRARLLYEAGNFVWNGNQNERAQELFQAMLDLHTGIVEEQKARYAMGRISESAKRMKDALAWFHRAASGPSSFWSGESRWRAAWVSYLSKDFVSAESAFAAIAAVSPRGTDSRRDAGLYWRARSLEHLDRAKESLAIYRRIVADHPDGYYAYLIEKRTGMRLPAMSVLSPATADPSELPAPLRRIWERADALASLGMTELAARDLEIQFASLAAKERRQLLPLLEKVGAFDDAARAASNLFAKRLISREQLNHHSYPLAYRHIVSREAGSRGLDPLLVYALMRQESAFDPLAVSPARATGLMQLMEPTAKRMAPLAGVASVDAGALFEPELNIKLGTTYLAQLEEMFSGNQVLVLAAYNAGEEAARRWAAHGADLAEDELVEQISYRETRDYVKKIGRNLRNYEQLYRRPAGEETSNRG